MILLKSRLRCIDNTGAQVVECIRVLQSKRAARVGERIACVVQRARPIPLDAVASSTTAGKVRRGDLRHAVITSTRKPVRRGDGTSVRFDDNTCVLVSKTGEPLGTRVSGAVSSELRGKKYSKILSLAPKIV